MFLEIIIPCVTVVTIVSIIAGSCVTYYSSNAKRALVNSEEKLHNLNVLMDDKDKHYSRMIANRDEELQRMTDIIKSLTEKNQNYSVNAKINANG